MKLSHSKLSTILTCPMSYYLTYVQGIYPKVEKAALSIGSAVHWGLEHDTEDLSEFWNEHGSFKTRDSYGHDQLLSEAMVHGYLKHRDEIYEEILKDPETGEKLELVEETHELYVNGRLKSFLQNVEEHKFVGIIDLLLLTNKGFIILDYKTSSREPDWNAYLDQIYRYIMLVETNFPDIPIVKIGIINLKKAMIRQSKKETVEQFYNRLKFEYELNDEKYVNYHEFPRSTIDETQFKYYINNLSVMCDMAETIDSQHLYFINYSAAMGQYGRSQFWDIFYHTPGAEVLYAISDYVYNADEDKFDDHRDCIALDMKVVDYRDKILNKYKTFEKELLLIIDALQLSKEQVLDVKSTFFDYLKNTYMTDDYLLELYWNTYLKSLEVNSDTLSIK